MLLSSIGRDLIVHAVGPKGELVSIGGARASQLIQHGATAARGKRVYLACSDGGINRAGAHHSLDMFEIDARGQPHRRASLALPQRPLHVAVDAKRARVHLAFNWPSAYACVALDAQGWPVAIEHHVLEPEVAGWFAHQVLPMTDDRVLLVCRGDDATADAAEHPGSLRLLCLADGEVRVSQRIAPRGGFGFGPRNAALAPDGHFLYVVLERQNRLLVFSYTRDGLRAAPCFDVTTLPLAPVGTAKQLAGDIDLHPSGRLAYVLNRSREPGGENSVTTFSIDPATGEPRHLDTLLLPGAHPRTVRVAEDGTTMAIAIMEPGAAGAEPAGVSILAIDHSGCPRLRCHWTPPDALEPVTWATMCPRSS